MVKITRFWGQFGGQPLKTKDLAVWRAACTCCGVLQNAPHLSQGHSRVNSWIQTVTSMWGLNTWSSAVAGHVVDSPCPVMERPSSQGQYQATADSNGELEYGLVEKLVGGRGMPRYPERTSLDILPYTHSGCDTALPEICHSLMGNIIGGLYSGTSLLSGIALAWVAYTIQAPMEGVLCHLH